MLDQIAAAFAREDYETAARLVKQLQQQSPNNPWIKLFVGRLQEVSGQFASAEQIYRALLRDTPSPKIALQARQALHRLETQTSPHQTAVQPATHSSDQELAEAEPDPARAATGVLVLEAISPEARQQVAQTFARIMRLDTYAARLLLPGRGWRLYRLGTIAELEALGKQLVAAEIPAFWLPLTAIQRIRVFRAEVLQFDAAQPTVICHSDTNQRGSFRFQWSEVVSRVEGRLPIFEQVVDKNARNQLVRKEQTQDYAQVFDLHLPHRNSILRFADWSYQFPQQESALPPIDPSVNSSIHSSIHSSIDRPLPPMSNRLKWNELVRSIDYYLANVPVWSDFPAFGESALDVLAMVRHVPSHIDLFRKAPSDWDVAFQVYSGLVFEQKSRQSA